MTVGTRKVGAERDWPYVSLIAAAAAIVYGRTLLPGISPWGDTTKWQLIGRIFGVPHPTGYPLYILLTHAFGWIPIGSLAMRINAFSAVCTLGALAVFFKLLRRLDCSRPASAVAALALAFTPTLWSQSVQAEVYALNALAVVVVCYLFVRWRATERDRDLLLACGAYALSFGNHLTMVLFLPALLYLVLSTKPRVLTHPRLVASVALLVALGAGQYAYLFVTTHAGGPHLEYRIDSMKAFVDYVSGERYRGIMFAFGLGDVLRHRVPLFLSVFWKELHVGLLVVPVGMFAVKDKATRIFLIVLAATYLVFVFEYGIFDIAVYCIPIYVLFMVWIAVGLTAMTRFFASARWPAPALLALLALGLLVTNYRASDMSGQTAFRDNTHELLRRLDRRALVIMDGWWLDYGWFEGVLYCLLNEREWMGRDLYVSDQLPAADVRRYLEEGTTLRSVVMADEIPRGLRVYTISKQFALDMREAGLHAESRGPGLQEVLAGSPVINIEFSASRVVSSESGAPVDQPQPIRLAEQGVFWEHRSMLVFRPATTGSFTVRTPPIKAGRYRAEFIFAASAESGIVDVRLADGTPILRGVDLYNASAPLARASSMLNVSVEGEQQLAFEVVGHNPRSGGYAVGVDYLDLTPVP